MRRAGRGAYRAAAELLVVGDGSPRSRETLIAQLESSLDAAYQAGVLAGRASAREAVLREALVIATAMEADAHHRKVSLERELESALTK